MVYANPGYKCGYLPHQIILKRGERQQIAFWSDQDYQDPVPTTTDGYEEAEDVELTQPPSTFNLEDDVNEEVPTLSQDDESTESPFEDFFTEISQQVEEFTEQFSQEEPVDEPQQAETTTEGQEMLETTTLLDDDEIAFDDEPFQEDFGTEIIESDVSIFDPQNDIADGQEGGNRAPSDVEFIEVNDDDVERIFDYTTIAYPDEKPVFEAIVAEQPSTNSQGLLLDTTTPDPSEVYDKPTFEAVLAEDEDDRYPVEGATNAQGLLIDTTTSKDKLISGLEIEAVIAEEDDDPKFDENGLLIETTTGVNRVAAVAQTLLEKQPRGADEDVVESNIQELDVTEAPGVANITDPSDVSGSILTTLIDGFLLQKQPVQTEETTVAPVEETAGGFPVTNILSGIYNLVSSYIQPTEDEVEEEPITAIPQNAINVHNMPRDQLIVEAASDDDAAPPLPILPAEYLRGTPIDIQPKPRLPKPESISGPVLMLNENGSNREPVSIPLPDLITEDSAPRSFDPSEAFRTSRFRDFIDGQPDPIKQHFIFKRDVQDSDEDEETTTTMPDAEADVVDCSWNIKTEPGLYLLATFHNLSAPYTLDCVGAYIEVERENNGFEARWCGSRVTTGGSRPQSIFAKNEVRITVYDDGSMDKEMPTGFSADIEGT